MNLSELMAGPPDGADDCPERIEWDRQLQALLLVSPVAGAAAVARRFPGPFGDVQEPQVTEQTQGGVDRILDATLSGAQAMLASQALGLNAIFVHLATRPDDDERAAGIPLALQAQAQSRQAIEALALVLWVGKDQS